MRNIYYDKLIQPARHAEMFYTIAFHQNNPDRLGPPGWEIPGYVQWNEIRQAIQTYSTNPAAELVRFQQGYWDDGALLQAGRHPANPGDYKFAAIGAGYRAIDTDLGTAEFVKQGQSAFYCGIYGPQGQLPHIEYDDAVEVFGIATHYNTGVSIRLMKMDAGDPTENFITDYNGNQYPVGLIGGKWVTLTNWRSTHLADGTPIPLVEDPTDWYNLADGALARCTNTY